MAVAYISHMNTNMMTICNVVVPKSNTGVTTPKKNNPDNGQLSEYEIIRPNKGTDKNNKNINKKSTENDESKFNVTLRKKMNPETSGQVHDGKDKKEKGVSKDKLEVDFQEMPNPANVVHEKLEKVIRTGQVEKDLSLEYTENTPVIKPEIDSSVETAVDSLNKEAGIIPENNEPTINTEIATPEVVITSDKMPNKVALENPKIPTESNQTLESKASEQQERTPEKLIISENNVPSAIEQTASTGDSVALEQSKKVVNDFLNTKNPENSLPAKAISNLMEKPATAAKENVSINADEKLQDTAQPQVLPQKTDISTEIHSTQASIHKMTVSMEQIESLKTEKQQNSLKNDDFEGNIGLDKQLSTDTGDPQTVMEKPAISGDSVKTIGSLNSGLGLGRQIQESVSNSYRPGTQQLIIRLNPADLGQVTIRFTEQRDGISGVLHVDKSQTQHEIQRALPGIVQNLQNSDIQIKKLEVVLNNQPQYDNAGEHPDNQNGGFGQQNSQNQNSFGNTASYNEWLASSNNINHSTSEQTELTDKSINMLI